MIIMSYPREKGQYHAIRIVPLGGDSVPFGVFGSYDKDGNIVAFDKTLPTAGAVGKESLSRNVDVVTQGNKCAIRLAQGATPNGSYAYLDDNGYITDKSGGLLVGRFYNSNTVTAQDNEGNTYNCAEVNIFNLMPSSSDGGGTGGVTQAQVDSSIKAVTDPIITRVSKNETDIKALQDAGGSFSAEATEDNILQEPANNTTTRRGR